MNHTVGAVCCVCRKYAASGSVVVDGRDPVEERPVTRNLGAQRTYPGTQPRVRGVDQCRHRTWKGSDQLHDAIVRAILTSRAGMHHFTKTIAKAVGRYGSCSRGR